MIPLETNESPVRDVDRRLVVWRWVFFGALTSLTTLLISWVHGGRFLNVYAYPYRAQFVGAVYDTTLGFLLLCSPFFIRRLHGLAVLAWLVSIVAFVWRVMPVF